MKLEHHLLGHQMHELNFRTSKLAGKTMQIALQSQRIAEETNRTTRINVQVCRPHSDWTTLILTNDS